MSQSGLYGIGGGGGGVPASTFPTDAGIAIPTALGALTIHGFSNISTQATILNTVSIRLTDDVSILGFFNAVGNIWSTAGNIYATAGNIYATAGSVAAGTTVTGGTGVIATTGNVTATVGNLVGAAWANPATPAVQSVTLNATGNVVIANPSAGTALTITNGGFTSTGTTTLLSLGAGAVQSTAGGVISSGTLGVGYGGTGQNTLLIHGLLVGNTVAGINSVAVGALNTILMGQTAADPAWSTATYPPTTAQGDILVSLLANTVTGLTKDINATRYLANTGLNNNPQWDQVALGTGVSGTLTVPNGGTGQITLPIHQILLGNAVAAIASLGTGSAGQILQSAGALADPVWTTATYPATTAQGDLLLSATANTITALNKDTNATRYLSNTGVNNNAAWAQVALATGVSGVLLPVNGGTGVSSPTIHTLPIAQGANNFTFTALTNGQFLIGSTGADPVAATLTSTGGTLVVTGGAGTLNVDTNASLQTDTGWASWGGAGNYFDDTTLGSFTVLRPGTGYIHNVLVSWTAPQTIAGMTAGNTYYIYIDSAGTIGKTASRTDALFQNNIVLFECLRGSSTPTNLQRTVRENHPYQFPVDVSNYLHDVVGTVIENDQNGANIVLNGTRKIQINGADVLNDHGVETIIPDSGGVGITWNQMFTNNSGKWATYTISDTFSSIYNAGGTITALSGNHFGIYRLFASKDNLNSSTPVYFAVIDSSQYPNLAQANNAISGGTVANQTGELQQLELVQLGYIVYRENLNQIVQVTISKTTLNQTISSGGGTNIASLITTVTTNFDGILSATDTNVQQALETIDDWGKGATLHGVLIGRGVNQPIVAQLLTDGQLLIGNTGNDPAAATLTAGAGISVTNAAGSITIAATSAGITWSEVTAATQAMAANNGYLANRGTLITFTLPVSCAKFASIQISGMSVGLWRIAQNVNQVIHLTAANTSTGIIGSIQSRLPYDCITLRCVVANLEFVVESCTGNLDYEI